MQAGILAPGPRFGRFLFFCLCEHEGARDALQALGRIEITEDIVLGIGPSLVNGAGGSIEALRAFPAMTGPGLEVPSTQLAAWCWLRGEQDPGELLHRSQKLARSLEPALALTEVVDGFKHGRTPSGLGRDLSGYEDGTENPSGDAARAAGIVAGAGAGLDGSSFVAVQKWCHDLGRFGSMTQTERDHVIGRRLSDNEELEDAPEWAHVKRTAQESFDPEAFLVRQSMPWIAPDGEGLLFVAFGKSFDAYEALLRRMVGLEDGVVDGLFRFTRPVSGGYYWCPPTRAGKLDLGALGI